MGVMACGRRSCENVMCDSYIDNQYICNTCKEEFRNKVGSEDRSREKFTLAFREFMRTEKTCGYSQEIVTIDNFLGDP